LGEWEGEGENVGKKSEEILRGGKGEILEILERDLKSGKGVEKLRVKNRDGSGKIVSRVDTDTRIEYVEKLRYQDGVYVGGKRKFTDEVRKGRDGVFESRIESVLTMKGDDTILEQIETKKDGFGKIIDTKETTTFNDCQKETILVKDKAGHLQQKIEKETLYDDSLVKKEIETYKNKKNEMFKTIETIERRTSSLENLWASQSPNQQQPIPNELMSIERDSGGNLLKTITIVNSFLPNSQNISSEKIRTWNKNGFLTLKEDTIKDKNGNKLSTKNREIFTDSLGKVVREYQTDKDPTGRILNTEELTVNYAKNCRVSRWALVVKDSSGKLVEAQERDVKYLNSGLKVAQVTDTVKDSKNQAILSIQHEFLYVNDKGKECDNFCQEVISKRWGGGGVFETIVVKYERDAGSGKLRSENHVFFDMNGEISRVVEMEIIQVTPW
jgi:hypothetical protein